MKKTYIIPSCMVEYYHLDKNLATEYVGGADVTSGEDKGSDTNWSKEETDFTDDDPWSTKMDW